MRLASCRYEVFCIDSEPVDPVAVITEIFGDEELAALVRDRVEHSLVERDPDSTLAMAPACQVRDMVDPLRMPHPPVEESLSRIMDGARVYHVISVDEEDPQDGGYLRGAMALAAAIGASRHGVIVDRTARIVYAPEVLRDVAGDLSVRDTVSISQEETNLLVTLRTRGMCKFGERDFIIEGLPPERVEATLRLLYDRLCVQAAFESSIHPGQSIKGLGGDPDLVLHFAETADGLLCVTDREPLASPVHPAVPAADGAALGDGETESEDALEDAVARARIAVEGDDNEETIASLERCLRIEPHHAWALGTLAERLARAIDEDGDAGRRAALLDRFEELGRSIRPDPDYSWLEWCSLAYRLNDLYAFPVVGTRASREALEAALDHAERALIGCAHNLSHQGTKIRLLVELGRTVEAFELTRWVQDQLPPYVEAHLADIVSLPEYPAWRAKHFDDTIIVPTGAEPPRVGHRVSADPTASPPDEPLTEEECERLLAALVGDTGWLRAQNAALVSVLLGSPWSIDELLELHWPQINLTAGRIRVGDGGIRLSTESVDKLRRWFHLNLSHPGHDARDGDPFVFCQSDLTPLTAASVEQTLVEVGRRAGIHALDLDRIALTHEAQVTQAARFSAEELEGLSAMIERGRELVEGWIDGQSEVEALQKYLVEAAHADFDLDDLLAAGALLGAMIEERLGMRWFMYQDGSERMPALRDAGDEGIVLFPLTMIVKRVHAGEPFSVEGMFDAIRAVLAGEDEDGESEV